MDKQEHEYFLLGIADKVAELVAVRENLKYFEQQSCNFSKKQAAYKEAKERGAKQMPPDPLVGFLSVLTYDKDNPDEPPQLKIDEALAYYYFSLATIHDKMREGYLPIHNDSGAKQLAKSIWPIIKNLCVDRQHIIKIALDHVKADLCPERPAETEPQAENMIHPTPKNISEIIEKLKTLKAKEVDYINRKCNVPADELAQSLATCHTRKPIEYTGSIEELIKTAAGLDGKLPEKELLKEDLLALWSGGRPTKTLAEVVPTLPIDELQRLLNEFLPELFRNTEISADNKRHLHEIKNSISRELEREKKVRSNTTELIETRRECELIRRKPKEYWPKAIQDLINEVDILLCPYGDYFKENGSWGKSESSIIEMAIKSGRPVDLDNVSQELEKIKHKMEVESQQLSPEKSAGTEQETKSGDESQVGKQGQLTMNGGRYKDFLLEVAEKVNEMVADSSKMERFRQQIKAFGEALQEEEQEYGLYEGKLSQYAREAAKDPRLRNKGKGPPKKGWIWKDDFTLDEVPKGFWMPAIKEPTLSRHYSIEPSETSVFAAMVESIVGGREIHLSNEERLQGCYVLLTVIHDKVFEYNQRVEPINDDIWEWNSERGYLHFGSLWQEMRDKSADEIVQADIKHALNKVEADLKLPAGARQGKKPGKESSEEAAMPPNYIPCIEIAGIIRKRSDAIARTLRAAKYPVKKKAGKNYCDPEHAAVLFPKWKKHLKRQQEDK